MAQNGKKERERKEDKAREKILKRATDITVYYPTKTIDEHIQQRKQQWDRMLNEEGHKFDEDDKESDYDYLDENV